MEMEQEEALDEKANSFMASLPTTSSAPSILSKVLHGRPASPEGESFSLVHHPGADSGVEDEPTALEAVTATATPTAVQPLPVRRSVSPAAPGQTEERLYGSLPDVDTALEQLHTAAMLASYPSLSQPGLQPATSSTKSDSPEEQNVEVGPSG